MRKTWKTVDKYCLSGGSDPELILWSTGTGSVRGSLSDHSWMTTGWWFWWDINQTEIKRYQEVAILHGPSQLTGCWLYDHLGTFYLLVVSCLERWQKGFNEDSQEMPPSCWWHNWFSVKVMRIRNLEA